MQLVRWVNRHSSFYRKHWAGHDLEDWCGLPAVDKRLMMQNFSEFNTAGVSLEAAMTVALRAERETDFKPTVRGANDSALTVGLSSGTSGHRGLFLVSPLETARWAGLILARALHRPLWHGERIAFFLRANSNLYERVGQGRLRFQYFNLMTPLDVATHDLEKLQPTVLVAPPSMLLALARRKPNVRPHSVIAVAEVLEPQDKTALESHFQVPVHSIYQATEGLIAVSCRCGRLHLQEDIVTVQLEPVSGDRTGSRFTPVLTDLWRRTQPIVRYRLNDILQLDPDPCPCGNPWRVLLRVEGRSDDTLEFIGKHGTVPVFPDTVRRAILLAHPQILEYAAQQSSPNQLRVWLEVAPGFETEAVSAVRESLQREWARYRIQNSQLEIGLGIPRQIANQKRRRVTRQNSDMEEQ